MNKEIGKQIADIVCEAWNTLDSSLFEPLGYKGELSVCTNCMEAVEFLPTILLRYK